MIRVMCGGCFDCLHIGHVRYLQAARNLGDSLIVALTVDSQVDKGPGRPVFGLEDRAQMLEALRCVDLVVFTRSGVDAVREWKPEIYCKGADWADKDIPERAIVEKYGGKVVFIDTPSYSSTKILTGELLGERMAAAGKRFK